MSGRSVHVGRRLAIALCLAGCLALVGSAASLARNPPGPAISRLPETAAPLPPPDVRVSQPALQTRSALISGHIHGRPRGNGSTFQSPAARRAPTPIWAYFPYPANAPYWQYLPITTDCDGPGVVFRSDFPSKAGGPRRSFHAYVPPCYGHDGRAYPVLYLFHGSVQTDSQWLDLGLAHYLDTDIANEVLPPAIVVMPFNDQTGNKTSGGVGSVEDILVDDLLPFVEDNFCTWREPAGRAIGGISRGGYWALEIAFRRPDLFGAVGGHSSQLRLETDAPRYNPLATYAGADLSGMRIWLDWGEDDFLRAGPQQLHTLLAAADVPHVARVNRGDHNQAYWAEHMGEYVEWYLSGWSLERETYPPCTHIGAS